jgi:DNA repair protein RadC|tara:strand:+ start:8410 stop:8964 length:555 start_codon:yes stop_codon:yes gene_type:complete
MEKRAQFDLFGINEAAKVYTLPGKGEVDLQKAHEDRENRVIQEAIEILERRFKEQRPDGDVKLTTPVRVADYLRLKYGELPYEVFSITWLDNQHAVLQHEELFRGTLDSASVYPREVVRRAIEMNAGACILSHNHPSGEVEPSQADRKITSRIVDTLGLIDVKVLDHFVVSGTSYMSFAERGII